MVGINRFFLVSGGAGSGGGKIGNSHGRNSCAQQSH